MSSRPYSNDLAMEESTGFGLMLSMREPDVEKLPKRQRPGRSPLIHLKGKGGNQVRHDTEYQAQVQQAAALA